MMHAVLMDVLGLGVLIAGESGIGKSECALDLIVRGHRLVADDTVEVRRRQETILIGTCPELTRLSHGAARPRRDQHQGAVRHRVDAIVEAGRARRPARTLGCRRASTSASASTTSFYEILGLRVPLLQHAGGARTQHRDPASRSRRAISCCASAAITRARELAEPPRRARCAEQAPPSPDEEDEEIESGGSQ